jgi:hypothetical protein
MVIDSFPFCLIMGREDFILLLLVGVIHRREMNRRVKNTRLYDGPSRRQKKSPSPAFGGICNLGAGALVGPESREVSPGTMILR